MVRTVSSGGRGNNSFSSVSTLGLSICASPWRRPPSRAVLWRSVPTGGLGGRAREHDTPDSAGAVLQAPAGLEHEAGGESGARIQNED